MIERDESVDEEKANALTHGLGTLLSLVAVPFLIYHAMQYAPNQIWPIMVYGIGIITVYLSSTLYHVATNPVIKHRLRIWDHISIYILIAGTYTPVILRYLPQPNATIFLSIMWSTVVIGCIMKIFYTGKLRVLSLALYLILGWMAVFVVKPLVANMSSEVFWWILAGGLIYTVGVTFYVWHRLKYNHAIWHCFVLAGTAAHFAAIYLSIKG